jgi:hypothetical protein
MAKKQFVNQHARTSVSDSSKLTFRTLAEMELYGSSIASTAMQAREQEALEMALNLSIQTHSQEEARRLGILQRQQDAERRAQERIASQNRAREVEAGRVDEYVHIYVDNTSLLLGCKKVTDRYGNKVKDNSIRVDFGELARRMEGGRRNVEDRVVVGASASSHDVMWKKWKELGFKVHAQELLPGQTASFESETLMNQFRHRVRNSLSSSERRHTLVLLTGREKPNQGRSGFCQWCASCVAFHSFMHAGFYTCMYSMTPTTIECRVSYKEAVHIALTHEWRVEIWTWGDDISEENLRYNESYAGTGMFSIVCLDDIRDEITFKQKPRAPREQGRAYEGDRARSQSRPRSRADDNRDQSQYTSPAAVATGSYGRSTARSQSRPRSRADDDRDQSQYTSPAAVATGSYGRSTARSQSRPRSRDQLSETNRVTFARNNEPSTGLPSGNHSRAAAAVQGELVFVLATIPSSCIESTLRPKFHANLAVITSTRLLATRFVVQNFVLNHA